MKAIILFMIIAIIIGGAFLRPYKSKLTPKKWEKFKHNNVII